MQLNEIVWDEGQALEDLVTWAVQPMQWANLILSERLELYDPNSKEGKMILRTYYFFDEKLNAMEKTLYRLWNEVQTLQKEVQNVKKK